MFRRVFGKMFYI